MIGENNKKEEEKTRKKQQLYQFDAETNVMQKQNCGTIVDLMTIVLCGDEKNKRTHTQCQYVK